MIKIIVKIGAWRDEGLLQLIKISTELYLVKKSIDMQREFAHKATEIWKKDENILGIAVGGSWITGEIDRYSDLDLVVVTKERISGDAKKMREYASQVGDLLSSFTGEHVGEPRLLICLYDQPLLHVDIKFLTLGELSPRVEDPELLFDRDGSVAAAIQNSGARFPYPDYQWIEDRFWTWIHYALLKIGRGELLEAVDFLAYLRMVVLGPLLQIANKQLPRGVRKLENTLPASQLESLLQTIPSYNKEAVLRSVYASVTLYRELRSRLFTAGIENNRKAEERVMEYFDEVKSDNKNIAG